MSCNRVCAPKWGVGCGRRLAVYVAMALALSVMEERSTACAGPGTEAAAPSQLPSSGAQAGGSWSAAWTTPNPGVGVRSSRARPSMLQAFPLRTGGTTLHPAPPLVQTPHVLPPPVTSTPTAPAESTATVDGSWKVVPIPARQPTAPRAPIPARNESDTELPPPGGTWSPPEPRHGAPSASPGVQPKGVSGTGGFVETRPPSSALPPYRAPTNPISPQPPVAGWGPTPPAVAMPPVGRPGTVEQPVFDHAPIGAPKRSARSVRRSVPQRAVPLQTMPRARRSATARGAVRGTVGGGPQIGHGAFRRPGVLRRASGDAHVIPWRGGDVREQGGMQPAADSGLRFRFAVGDKVKIAVWGEKELVSEQAVLPDGTIVPPLLEPMMVKGRSISDVRNDLMRGYENHQEVGSRDVILTVSRLGVKDRAFILGEVGDATAVELTEPRTLLQVLAEAGGPVGGVSDLERIRVVRTRNRSGRPQVFRVNAMRIMQGRLRTFMIQPGDVVYVPATGTASWSRDMQMRLAPLQTLIGGAATAALAITTTGQ